MIYLDNAATTLVKPLPVPLAVSRAIISAASPGRGAHPPAMRAAELVYSCREEAAELFQLEEPEQVVFTMNATHALNIALFSLVSPGDPVLISGFEHNSVTRPLHAVGAKLRIAGRKLFDPEETLRHFRERIRGTKLVVCTQVSNAFGYMLPLREIGELCREERVPLVVDASQGAGVLPLDFRGLDAAFAAMPGHKGLYGPQGTGILLCKDPGRPLLFGGSGSDSVAQRMPESLPDRLEAGTHNVCGIAGLLEGLRFVREKGLDTILRHERKLLRIARRELSGGPLELFAGPEELQTGVLSLRPVEGDCDLLAQALAERGVCVRSGLHCAPLAHESAGTLESGTLRISVSAFTTEEEMRAACGIIRDLAERRDF